MKTLLFNIGFETGYIEIVVLHYSLVVNRIQTFVLKGCFSVLKIDCEFSFDFNFLSMKP